MLYLFKISIDIFLLTAVEGWKLFANSNTTDSRFQCQEHPEITNNKEIVYLRYQFFYLAPWRIGNLKYLEVKIEEWTSMAKWGQAGPNGAK